MKFFTTILGLVLAANSGGSFDKARFFTEVRDSEIVVIAEVLEIRPSITTFWSGAAPCWQTVRYRVKEVLKGNVDQSVIDVGHLLVMGSLTADKGKPLLSAKLFKRGRRLVLLLRSKTNESCSGIGEPASTVKRFCSHDENYGATPATDDTLGLVQKALTNGK